MSQDAPQSPLTNGPGEKVVHLETAEDIIKVFGGPSTSPLVDESFQFASDKVSLPSRVTPKKRSKAAETKPRAKTTTKAPKKKASRRG